MIRNTGIVVIFIAMEAFVQFTLGSQFDNDYDDYNFIDRFRPGHESNINWAHVSHAPSIEFDVSTSAPQPMPMQTHKKTYKKRVKFNRSPRKTSKMHHRPTYYPVAAIKVYQCADLYLRCEYRPNYQAEYPLHCQVSDTYKRIRFDRHPPSKNHKKTHYPVKAIKVYQCGDFYMKCEYRPNYKAEYPLDCKMSYDSPIDNRVFTSTKIHE